MANDNNKDIAKSLNKYTDLTHKGTNVVLDSADNINKWYAEQLKKITANDADNSRIETGIDNDTTTVKKDETKEKQISTKVKQYNELQTNKSNEKNIIKSNKIQTVANDEVKETTDIKNLVNKNNKKLKNTKRIATAIKGTKLINNFAQKMIRTGKTINTGLNENGTTAFEGTSSRIMTKPIRSASKKVTSKITKETTKYTKKLGKKIGKKVKEKVSKKIASNTTNVMIKAMKLVTKIVEDTVRLILNMLPQIAPIIIIIVIIAAIGDFLHFKTTKEADDVNFDEIADMMIVIEDENLQAIYNEFLKNIGTPYLMDHSNLKYDECMDYYDCSSWVIHCLAHAGIKTISNTGAEGIYNDYCNPIDVNDRKGGDLIFLKDTYDTGEPGSISHIGIYMGTLTINGETAEWVIDTGSNPSGVRIRRYDNGWWNGPNFYGFARLK